jgi:precorrin-8X/cobalt-precorrin-8 methylmutase
MGRDRVHPIEVESMRILASRVDLSGLPPLSRVVTARIIHATADPGWYGDLVPDEAALRRGWRALAAGAPIVADARMVAAGVTGTEVWVPLADPDLSVEVPAGGTRSAAAMAAAAARVGPGAVWVVGAAPTALTAVLARARDPALVIGLPVGFVGAAESKEALVAAGTVPYLIVRGRKGGSAMAAAAVNALASERE